MRLITLLNQCHHFPGFVYEKVRLCPDGGAIALCDRAAARSRFGLPSARRRLRSARPPPLRIRPVLWGMVLLLYRMRRVDCRACGVRVEELPWAIGKHQLASYAVPGSLGAQAEVLSQAMTVARNHGRHRSIRQGATAGFGR
jgi:transposase